MEGGVSENPWQREAVSATFPMKPEPCIPSQNPSLPFAASAFLRLP